jgi:hypothetical protein
LSKALFPSRRFRGIGATREEVAEMEDAFSRSDIIVQKDVVDHLKSLSASALRVYLAGWRAQYGDVDESEPESGDSEAPEEASPESAPGGLTSESGDGDFLGTDEE